MDNVIALQGLSKRYGDNIAVQSLDLTVKRGQIFGFMGHNGAGKTTTLQMLLGLTRPTAGQAQIMGYDVVQESLAVRRLVGFLPAEYSLPLAMTARRFLHYIAAFFGLSHAESAGRIDRLLAQFNLTEVAEQKLSTFSAGMRQKIGLAQALINEPAVLLLDEPTASLDPIGRHELLHYLQHLAHEQQVTVLFSSHILSDIEQICEQVAILHQGQLLAQGSLTQLKAQHAQDNMDALYLKLVREVI
jgi:ABC-2 type transport system ATP-binding protein